MAIQTLKTYDLDEVYCTVGPVGGESAVRIDGYTDDGGIEFDTNSDLGSMSIGNTGLPVFSRNHDELVMATITISEMSVVTRRLAALLDLQRDQSPIEPCPFFLKDTINGDQIEDEYGVFMTLPTPDKSSEAGGREFQLALPNARDKIQLATNIQV